jgi:hypothetical protein
MTTAGPNAAKHIAGAGSMGGTDSKRPSRHARLVPGIHVFLSCEPKTWMAGTSPAMTILDSGYFGCNFSAAELMQ